MGKPVSFSKKTAALVPGLLVAVTDEVITYSMENYLKKNCMVALHDCKTLVFIASCRTALIKEN